MPYLVGFVFLECEKEDNVTRALQVCQNLLKDQENMPHAIATECDSALINSVAKVELSLQ